MGAKRFARYEPEELTWFPKIGEHVGYTTRGGNGEQFFGLLQKIGRKNCRVKLDRTNKTITVPRNQLFFAPTQEQIRAAAYAVRMRRELERNEDYTC